MIFIAFSAWTMISLVTAVVSDNVIQALKSMVFGCFQPFSAVFVRFGADVGPFGADFGAESVRQATQDRKEKQKEAQERRRKEFVDFLKAPISF